MANPSLYEVYLQHPVVCTDTRQIKEGCLFFALHGEHFDGNTFAKNAITNGAAYAVVSEPSLHGGNFIQVSDTLLALQQLAQEHRRHLNIPVIAITGSNGKTTTKELLTTVLSSKFKVFSTQGNLNNHIGVPLTLLGVSDQTEILVCKMGANHGGEIAALCNIANPTHGLITNIGKAHLEGFGSYEGVKKAKGELFNYLNLHDGMAFVNMDDPALVEMSHSLKNKTSFGLKDNSDPDIHFRCSVVAHHEGFILDDRHSSFQIQSSLFGVYNASNMLAAYTIGKYFDIAEAVIAKSLSSFVSGSNRSEKLKWKGCTVIKDAYNANPSSMELALQAFADQYPGGWVVLGDMKELGAASGEAHLQIIKMALQHHFKKIFLVGPAFRQAYTKLPKEEWPVTTSEDIDELRTLWNWEECQDGNLLLKGSRSMRLEKLLE